MILGIRRDYSDFNIDTLNTIVNNDNKQRYSFNEAKTKIRANQGHSIAVDLELQSIQPPKLLYHGTGIKYAPAIDNEGLKSKSRQYVHLSSDIETAKEVGARHGQLVIYTIESEKMYMDGYKFYISKNAVWLTETVPQMYLHKIL